MTKESLEFDDITVIALDPAAESEFGATDADTDTSAPAGVLSLVAVVTASVADGSAGGPISYK